MQWRLLWELGDSIGENKVLRPFYLAGIESSSMHSGPDPAREPKVATLWVHDDSFCKSTAPILLIADEFPACLRLSSRIVLWLLMQLTM